MIEDRRDVCRAGTGERHDRAMRQPLAAMRSGGRQRDRLVRVRCLEANGIVRGERSEGRTAVRGEQQIGGRCLDAGRDTSRRVGQHDVRVGPAEAEGIDARQPRPADARRQGRRSPGDLKVQCLEIDMRGQLLAVQRGWQDVVLERQHRLEYATEPGGRLHVADVGLDRADQERRGAARGERLADRRRLDRIAHGRAGAVRLDEGEVGRVEALLDVELVQELRLERLGRQRDAVGAPVRVDVGADDQAVDVVAVALGRFKGSKHEHRAAPRRARSRRHPSRRPGRARGVTASRPARSR